MWCLCVFVPIGYSFILSKNFKYLFFGSCSKRYLIKTCCFGVVTFMSFSNTFDNWLVSSGSISTIFSVVLFILTSCVKVPQTLFLNNISGFGCIPAFLIAIPVGD